MSGPFLKIDHWGEVFSMEKSSNHKQLLTSQLVEMSVLAGCSYVLMFIAVPIIPIVPYMKIDLSDIPILIGTVIFGPVGGMIIAALRSLLHWLTIGGASIPDLIGTSSALLSSITLVWTFHWGERLFSFTKGIKKALLVIATMTIGLTVIMSLSNWAAVIPLYMKVIGLKLNMPLALLITYGVIPFNLIKGIVVGGIFYGIKGSFLPRLKLK
jgi:riboflavin transporter FmnP